MEPKCLNTSEVMSVTTPSHQSAEFALRILTPTPPDRGLDFGTGSKNPIRKE